LFVNNAELSERLFGVKARLQKTPKIGKSKLGRDAKYGLDLNMSKVYLDASLYAINFIAASKTLDSYQHSWALSGMGAGFWRELDH
jgi:hypothetical protein